MTEEPDPILSTDEALLAARHFVRQYYDRGRSEAVMPLLHNMAADPATASDWRRSVDQALAGDDPDIGPMGPPTRP